MTRTAGTTEERAAAVAREPASGRPQLSAAPEWRASDSPLRVLVASGWLSPSEEGDARVKVDVATSSHMLVKVAAPDGRSVVVKQVRPEASAAGRTLGHEFFVYRLARWHPAIAAAAPRAVAIDEKQQLLVTEAVGSHGPWPGPHPAPTASPRVLARLGTLMAAWHRTTQETGLWTSPAFGILELPDHTEMACEGRSQPTRHLMRSIAEDQELSGVLRAARAAWLDRCLIHGDIRRENWVACQAARRIELKVLDWEFAGSGDPAWDIGSVLAEVALDSVRDDRAASAWSPAQNAAAASFLRAYTRSGGLVSIGAREDWLHVAHCAIARLLHIACEWEEVQREGLSPAPQVMVQARRLVQVRDRLIAACMRWTRPGHARGRC